MRPPLLALALVSACSGAVLASEQVPFIGCPGDGQVGPIGAPSGPPKTIDADAATARMVAYYQADDGFGTLAPKGWKCFYTYGSSGSTLFVSPDVRVDHVVRVTTGDAAVVVSVHLGDTSGRFTVAQYLARLFPEAEHEYVQDVIDEGLMPEEDFPVGPYPDDRLIYKGPRTVEFETPADREGLGTRSLRKSSNPIRGVVVLSPGHDLMVAAIRTPAKLRSVGSLVIAEIERAADREAEDAARETEDATRSR